MDDQLIVAINNFTTTLSNTDLSPIQDSLTLIMTELALRKANLASHTLDDVVTCIECGVSGIQLERKYCLIDVIALTWEEVDEYTKS